MRILVLGEIFDDDLKHLPKDWEIVRKPAPKRCKEHIDGDYDFAIAVCFGAMSSNLLSNGFTNLKCKKAVWFLDSHVLLQEELRVAKLIDYAFVAHSPFIDKFPCKSFHLHCGTHRIPIDRIMNREFNNNPKWDAIMGFNSYNVNGNYRDKTINNICKIFKNNLKINIGRIDYNSYVDCLFNSRVGLNMSLFNDYNIRNSENIAAGLPNLTNKTIDHTIEELDLFSRYYDPNNLNNIMEHYEWCMDNRERLFEPSKEFAIKQTFPYKIIEMVETIKES